MWFVILKTLLSEDPCAGSAQPEMLLVADDANAAYSNPRPLPKCAQNLLPCTALAYRTRVATRAPRGLAGPWRRKMADLAVSVVEPTLVSMIWETGVRTPPARTGPGGANRRGNRHQALER